MRSHQVFFLSEQLESLTCLAEKKKQHHLLKLLRSTIRTNHLTREIVKNGKEICAKVMGLEGGRVIHSADGSHEQKSYPD